MKIALALIAVTACTTGVQRYRDTANQAAASAEHHAIHRFRRDHDVTPIAVTRLPRAQISIVSQLPVSIVVRSEHGTQRVTFPDWLGTAVVGEQRVVVFGTHAKRDHEQRVEDVRPRYRFYRARDGHVIVLRLVPDVRRNWLVSFIGWSEPERYRRSHPDETVVVLDAADLATVEVVDIRFARDIIEERFGYQVPYALTS